ncbi:MAG: DMT family transporter [Oligoflexia bacterium]|nr:DMT family transporter [Oligoflexia bacterium]
MRFLILITALLVLSQSAILIRFANASAEALGLWRMLIAVPVLGFFLLWRGVKKLSWKKQECFFALLSGFFLFIHFYTWFLAVQKTTVANAMILFSSNPVFTAIGAYFWFREKLYLRHFIALAFSLLGILVLVSQSLEFNSAYIIGDGLAILCSIFFSAYVLAGKNARKTLDNLSFTFLAYSICGLCFAIIVVYTGAAIWGFDKKTWLALLGLAFGSTLMGHALLTYSLNFFNINLVSISTLSEPIATIASASYFFQEKITWQILLGCSLIAVGVLILYLPYIRKNLFLKSV